MLHQRPKFHLIIAFHCRVTVIFVKVVFVTPSQIWTFENGCEKWIEKWDKILFSVKEIYSRDWSWCTKHTQMRKGLEIRQSPIGIRPTPKAEKILHCFPLLDDHWAVAQRRWWIQTQSSFEQIVSLLFDHWLNLWVLQNCLSIWFCARNWKCGES